MSVSMTPVAIERVSVDRLKEAIRRVTDGYVGPTGTGVGGATHTTEGCSLATKRPNSSGYIQVDAPRFPHTPSTEPDFKMQLAGRIICYLKARETGNQTEIDFLLRGGGTASHRCGKSVCLTPDHLCVESKPMNESRKECQKHFYVLTEIDYTQYLLAPNHTCNHLPPCILMSEEREAMMLALSEDDLSV